MSSSTKSNGENHQVLKLSANLRNACLPKMLCEIAAKPRTALSDKEKSLLDLLTWVFSYNQFAFENINGLHTEIIQ